MKFWTAVLATTLALATLDADAARRLGGGRSIGRQSGNVTQREAAPPAPAAPAAAPAQQSAAQQPGQAARPATPAAPAAQPAPRRPWGAMLGGLAAGLGLAWLAHSLGFGPALAQFMLFALLALVIMAVIGFLMRNRRRPAMAGGFQPTAAELATAPRQYSPDKVGNDASARPWERGAMAFESARAGGGGIQIGSGLAGAQNWAVPAGFDVSGFVGAAKRNFMTLQDAWDRSDIATLRSMMTDEMLAEIRHQLAEREKELGGQPNKTEVVLLEAQLLGIEDLGNDYMASVEFSGLIREQPSAGPSPFREVWNMTKPKSGASGWLVGGVQALQ
ncbi:MAG TPA: Tim44-like domain-containing protein [Ramlibacter sp.]|jgi:predicted lipid-binding transport protein (Tim44 family)|uniref:Tim44 domain-containing protein n=1 Tax=Ramlibacter sp. TaxID=1917967 RepID=UPI002D63597E|nr:Tim44-like domain-containing protein [Ramlibacter sp.]HZY17600.1 Tim44-like domain-containing protein [Ramlibacter sp.]